MAAHLSPGTLPLPGSESKYEGPKPRKMGEAAAQIVGEGGPEEGERVARVWLEF